MLKHKLISLDNLNDWNAALEGMKYCFAHRNDYCRAMALTLKQSIFLYVCEGLSGRIVCPLSVRYYQGYQDVFTPYGNGGFISRGELPHFQEEWCDFMSRSGFICAYISCNQLFHPNLLFPQSSLAFNKTMYHIDLRLTEDELLNHFGRNNRRLLRRWNEQGYSLVDDQQQCCDRFLQLYPQFIKSFNASSCYHFSDETFKELFCSTNVYFLGIAKAGKIISVRCYLYTPHCVDAFLEASEPGCKEHSRALYWYAILYFKEKNIPYLNLGGGITQNDSLERYKSSLATEQSQHYVIKKIFNQDQYEKLCRLAAIDIKRAHYFPAYLSNMPVSSPIHSQV